MEKSVANDDSLIELEKIVNSATIETEVECPPVNLTPTHDRVEYPTGPKLALISLALCLAVFLVALGMSAHPVF